MHGLPLIHALGYQTAPRGSAALLLIHDDHSRAVAVLLNETEVFDRPSARFGAVSPIAHGLTVAAREELPWLVVLRGTQIRLYPAKPDVGVGRKGQAETYTELDLALLLRRRGGIPDAAVRPVRARPGRHRRADPRHQRELRRRPWQAAAEARLRGRGAGPGPRSRRADARRNPTRTSTRPTTGPC